MKTAPKKFEMPFLHTMSDDFGLGDPFQNRQQLERLLTGPYRIVQEDDNVLLAVTAYRERGEVFLCKKNEPALTFYLTFKVDQVEPLGLAATDVALWRRCAPGLEHGTSHIMDYLLDEFDAVLSNARLTPAAERFWTDRMAEAYVQGWDCGLMVGNTLLPYHGERPLLEWIQSLGGSAGKDGSGNRCFYISKTAD